MKLKSYVLFILFSSYLFVFAKLITKEEYVHYKGIATDLKSNQFYYTEEHKEVIEQDRLVETIIQYKDSLGNTIAKKTIDYSLNKITPSFEQHDYRDGYTEGVSIKDNTLVLKYRKNKAESVKVKSIKIPKDLVVDGGFNYYIKTHWDKIRAGQTMVFNFAVPSQLDYFSFRLYQESHHAHLAVFRMEPDHFLLRSLVDPIRVTYNTSNKRIVKYEGLSNINDKTGKSYLVKITYPKVGP